MEDNLARVEPREDIRAQLHFSYSQLSTYLTSPMKYAHNYVWATPWETKPTALPFGKAIHKSAEAFCRALLNRGETIPVEQVIETFTAVYDRETKNSELRLTMEEGETVGGLRDQEGNPKGFIESWGLLERITTSERRGRIDLQGKEKNRDVTRVTGVYLRNDFNSLQQNQKQGPRSF